MAVKIENCDYCGEEFESYRKGHRFCCREHKELWYQEKYEEDSRKRAFEKMKIKMDKIKVEKPNLEIFGEGQYLLKDARQPDFVLGY